MKNKFCPYPIEFGPIYTCTTEFWNVHVTVIDIIFRGKLVRFKFFRPKRISALEAFPVDQTTDGDTDSIILYIRNRFIRNQLIMPHIDFGMKF